VINREWALMNANFDGFYSRPLASIGGSLLQARHDPTKESQLLLCAFTPGSSGNRSDRRKAAPSLSHPALGADAAESR
jgi:hypothetical protein